MSRRVPRSGRFFSSRPSAGPLSLLLALGLALGSRYLVEPNGRLIEGRAYAIDGDTLSLNSERIRIKGIDAPEMSQSCVRAGQPFLCGEKARDVLLGMILNHRVACRVSGRDRYRRLLARCSVDGQDIGARMVSEGCAVAYGDYRALELKARLRSAGIWSTAFLRPQEWRRRNAY